MNLSTSVGYSVFMLCVGSAIPVMAALNSALGAKLQNSALAALTVFVVGGLSCLLIMVVVQPAPQKDFNTAPPIYYLGGVIVAVYILGITWVAPRFGVGNSVFFVLIGQLFSATLVDHFGLIGAKIAPLDIKRSIGLLLMTSGVFLARRPM